MWYVMQVRTGTEENIRVQCVRKIPPEILERCFIPYYEEKKRIRGEWTVKKKVLFPGYVFVVTEDMDLDAVTGGFNLQIAWSTDFLAGTYAGDSGQS